MLYVRIYKTFDISICSVKKEVATVAGISQDKPVSSVEGGKNGASCTPINGSLISATFKATNGTNMNGQVVTQPGVTNPLAQVYLKSVAYHVTRDVG